MRPDEIRTRLRQEPLLLRWLLLCVPILACVVLLMALGFYTEIELWLISILAQHPIYLTAEEAQHNLLSNQDAFILTACTTLYLGLVLLRESSPNRRWLLLSLAVLTTMLAIPLGALYGGILNTGAILTAILLLGIANLFFQSPKQP